MVHLTLLFDTAHTYIQYLFETHGINIPVHDVLSGFSYNNSHLMEEEK